jgi:hypothetical protein
MQGQDKTIDDIELAIDALQKADRQLGMLRFETFGLKLLEGELKKNRRDAQATVCRCMRGHNLQEYTSPQRRFWEPSGLPTTASHFRLGLGNTLFLQTEEQREELKHDSD